MHTKSPSESLHRPLFDMATNSISAANRVHSLPKTTSRCITESFTATHDFEVTNYLQLDGMGVNKFVSSSTFSLAGYDWFIRFYPDGDLVGSDENNTSAFLSCVSQPKGVRTKFTLNMVEKEGKVKVTDYRATEHTISPPDYDWGYSKFVKKSKLKSLSDGTGNLIIRCVLTVTKETDLVVPQSNLLDHLLQMWKDREGADVTFSVCGQLFRAHRCLLAARSPVFKAELFGPMKEKSTECSIKIDDIEPQIFEALFHFIYTDSMLDGDEGSKEGKSARLQHLLVAADRYGLEKLRVMCEGKLCETIDVETVATTLVLAEQHYCKDVKEACLEFMASRKQVLRAVMETDGFKHLVTSCPLLMKEILEKVSRSD